MSRLLQPIPKSPTTNIKTLMHEKEWITRLENTGLACANGLIDVVSTLYIVLVGSGN